ncbi:NACHT and WD domain protein [Xylaria arbuscula]|nr:NACHT and WD domain protein [Xylaria arbuscula]
MTHQLLDNELFRPSLPDSPTAYVPETRGDPRQRLGEDGLETRTVSTSNLRRRIPLIWAQKRQDTGQATLRGPFGLHLLHASPQPLIHIVFVHGLRGGSFKTWRKGDDPRLFWPQNWLPTEHDLRNASIHSFGYDSDWGSFNPSVLNVHDFGQTLYEEMRSSPYLRQDPDSPIIMIGHSMGGLAYILAHQNSAKHQLAERIRCIFFLATPHKGSEYASLLNRILKISGITGITSSREYITELTKGSISAQLINEDFARYASDLSIYSFYETLETVSFLIVDKDSAVLGPGFKNEIARYMNANHRGVCKFDSPEDPNYLSLKHSLGSAVQEILNESIRSYKESSKLQLRELQAFLEVSGFPDDSHDDKLEGSCRWLDERDDFREWRDSGIDSSSCKEGSYTPAIYWLTASPGAGKTILAKHVLSQLANEKHAHAFWNFQVGKKALESLAHCLRSIAYQMAVQSSAIRIALLNLKQDGIVIDPEDIRAIWHSIFRTTIFQTPKVNTQFWVLDAIDECLGYPKLFKFLKSIQPMFPLKIFFTSRKLPDFPQLIHQLDCHAVHVVEIPIADTMYDINLYVRNRIQSLPIERQEDKENIAQGILSKSNASFLWVRLVLDELESVYSYESILSVLHGIPEGMVPYYKRIVTDMSGNKREKHIIEAILVWVVCTPRPLTILELAEAIRIDIGVYLPSARTAIEGLCGQLVSVDKQTGLVQVVHATVREFLLSDEVEDFRISRSEANERLALICLQLLIGPMMRPPKHARLLAQKRHAQQSSPLLEYAITHFSEHIHESPAQSDKLLTALNRFLCATVLSWIERIAAGKNLHSLTEVARNLRKYLDQRVKYRLPSNQQINTVASWTADLSRLVMQFGAILVLQPQAIYFLVPPLCPNETAIYRQFGRSPGGLRISGFTKKDWDDCAAMISFEDDAASAIACDNRYIAVGFHSGKIELYSHGVYQKRQIIRQKNSVDRLFLDPAGTFIASSSFEYITAWDLDGHLLWQNRIESHCILLEASSSVICVMESGRATWWDANTGEELECHDYPYQAPKPPDQLLPFAASFNPNFELLALAYSRGSVCIYELQTHQWISWAFDQNRGYVTHIVFNPNPNVDSLLLAYDDSHLALYEPWSGTLIHAQKSNRNVRFQSVSCSPDGRIFSTVDSQGNLRIWDFETLNMLYQILTPVGSNRMLNFAPGGFSIIDAVADEMRIWAPSALIRKTVEEQGSSSDEHAPIPDIAGQYDASSAAQLRVAVSHEYSPFLVGGHYNGDVIAYDHDGSQTGVLYSHSHALSVTRLALSKGNNYIASSDVGIRVQVWELDTSHLPALRTVKQAFQTRMKAAVHQLLFDDDGKYLLIATRDSDCVYEVATSTLVGSMSFRYEERRVWKWTYLPPSAAPGRFTLVCDGKVTSYSIVSFPSKIVRGQVELELNIDAGFTLAAIDSIAVNLATSSLIVEVSQRRGFITSSSFSVFQIPELFKPSQDALHAQSLRVPSLKYYTHFLGVDQADGNLIFLDKDSWVCSVNLSALTDKQYVRHCFVPNEFITRARDVHPLLTKNKSLIFALRNKFAVIKNGLTFQEIIIEDSDLI